MVAHAQLIVLLASALLALLTTVHGHGSMIMPPSRNAIDSETPAWSDGKHPMTGVIEPYSCVCTNGTGPCNTGQSCFWFSQGCTIGCSKCDGDGTRLPNYDHCPGQSINATLNDPRFRTANQLAPAGSVQDIYKYNPWRAPGKAPVSDSCGMAGGNAVEVFNAGAYNTTIYAKQGDLGTVVLKPRPSGTVWQRGSIARARWEQTANHGGGYRYRLCPANESLTEECFQAHELDFADPTKHTVVWGDGTTTEIAARLVTEGGGVGWMMWPLPNPTRINCDYIVKDGEHCPWKCPRCGAPWYAADDACPTDCSKQYPGLPSKAGSNPLLMPNPLPGHDPHSFAIEDTLRVPADIPAGDYVLGWRWDCETSSQVWTTCSDITIV